MQIMIGLIRPFNVLLLDEIRTFLDVCERQNLLNWLIKESNERGATILYATRLFDELDDWVKHLHYLKDEGKCGWQGEIQDLDKYKN